MDHLSAIAKRAAQDAGFDLCGVAPARDPPELNYFAEWIALGYAGEMKYLEARNALACDPPGSLKRSSLSETAPWARSVIVCAINYNTAEPYSIAVHDSTRGWLSRYAWGVEDYHDSVMRRLRLVEGAIRTEATKDSQNQNAEVITRCYVDTGPLVERVYAKYAGVGWIGKNTCIINQQKGSWLFLGVILTSLEMQVDFPAPDRCGTCTRCISACPTNAFVGPYQLDANKCISYLTIEKRGLIPEELAPGIGHQVFGCDICQDVCPWNRKAPASTEADFQPRPELVNPALDWLAEMSEEDFRRIFRKSAVRRTKHSGLRRNAVVAMGNSANREFLPIIQKLTNDEDEVVAETARSARDLLLRNT
ncbi:MAG TPA: tRNA epoxyqueuosine(34) reductase QueG [Candidatus Sulfotelmatobacter sp.]